MNAFRTIHRFWASLMLLAVVVQIGFAGYGAFSAADKASNGTLDEDSFTSSFDPHAILGTFIVLGGLVLLLFSFGTKNRRRMMNSLVIFVLLVAQLFLGWTGASLPAVLGFLHPINALLILAVLGRMTFEIWNEDRVTEMSPTPATATPPA